MPTDSPPSYQSATGAAPGATRPGVSVTTPQGQVLDPESAADRDPLNPFQSGRPGHRRAESDASDISDLSDDGLAATGKLDDDERRSMDDERRDLPEGWVRCFDPKTMHHFYVDTSTKRSTWLHPYDDPEFLRTLPASHPANPNSHEAQALRKRSEDEKYLAEKAKGLQGDEPDHHAGGAGPSRSQGGSEAPIVSGGGHERNWFQKKKDKLIGTKEERQKIKEEKKRVRKERQEQMMKEQAEYMKRRQELIDRQINDPVISRYYAQDPYAYPAPMAAYSRMGGMYDSPYGYGYGGGYGRRYGYGPYVGGMGMGMGGPGMGMGMGGMGMGMGVLGGLAGGILLGDAIGGGF